MLFNSFEFIFAFLPLTLLGFFIGAQLLPSGKRHWLRLYLVIASLFFYGWWNPQNLWLIGFSIGFNYLVGRWLGKETLPLGQKKGLLSLGVGVNLALIFYFKYANFFADNFNQFVGTEFNFGKIILPLAISFFTFQQIAYLVDSYRGETKNYGFISYCLFVCFFPQLIAGPIVHHKDVLGQFEKPSIYKFSSLCFSVGCFIFFAGLFKKVVLADRVAIYATPVFDAAAQGISLSFFEAWIGALAYTLQLYFDFSGYTDMAIGAAYMFGIRLPLNFDSPYKATSIIDFWRRWHITLSNFLRDYLYIPLGGSRKGKLRRHANLLITMLLGGFWHGAGWTFVIWGGLHGTYLIINHQWRSFCKGIGLWQEKTPAWFSILGWAITFLAVVASWVLFRANNLETGLQVLGSMFGSQGFSLPRGFSRFGFLTALAPLGIKFDGLQDLLAFSIVDSVKLIGALIAIALFTPNTQQWLMKYNPTLNEPQLGEGLVARLWSKLHWRPNQLWAVMGALVATLGLWHINRVSEFLYFQF